MERNQRKTAERSMERNQGRTVELLMEGLPGKEAAHSTA
jgi:hypothetical protein